MTVSLYDLGAEFAALEAMLIESGGEWTPEVESRFAALGALEGDKVDAYASVIRQQEAAAKVFGGEADAFQAKADAFQAKADAALAVAKRLKARMLEYMQGRDVAELRGALWRFARQRNGGKAPLRLEVEPDALPEKYRVVRYFPDTDALRADAELCPNGVLEVGGVPLARLESPGEHIRIR